MNVIRITDSSLVIFDNYGWPSVFAWVKRAGSPQNRHDSQELESDNKDSNDLLPP